MVRLPRIGRITWLFPDCSWYGRRGQDGGDCGERTSRSNGLRTLGPLPELHGRWLAHQSNASGQEEIYIRAFMAPADTDASAATAMSGVWQISTAGGIYPTWSPDGQELYYLDPDANMMAAPFSVTGDSVEVGNPIALFPTRIVGGGTGLSQGWQYNVAADGRFLINTLVGEASTTPITLILNWNPEVVQ